MATYRVTLTTSGIYAGVHDFDDIEADDEPEYDTEAKTVEFSVGTELVASYPMASVLSIKLLNPPKPEKPAEPGPPEFYDPSAAVQPINAACRATTRELLTELFFRCPDGSTERALVSLIQGSLSASVLDKTCPVEQPAKARVNSFFPG